jgi:prepilin-type N-terminal cleavage/methylation domain-containing protein
MSARGFTLLEILITMAILTIMMALGLFLSLDMYRGFTSRSERDVVVAVLQKARSRALANIDQTRWGVCYIAPNYLLFRGAYSAGAATNEPIPAAAAVTLAGFPACGSGSEIVFDQLTAKLVPQLSPSTAETTITISQTGRPDQTVAINNEGRINW